MDEWMTEVLGGRHCFFVSQVSYECAIVSYFHFCGLIVMLFDNSPECGSVTADGQPNSSNPPIGMKGWQTSSGRGMQSTPKKHTKKSWRRIGKWNQKGKRNQVWKLFRVCWFFGRPVWYPLEDVRDTRREGEGDGLEGGEGPDTPPIDAHWDIGTFRTSVGLGNQAGDAKKNMQNNTICARKTNEGNKMPRILKKSEQTFPWFIMQIKRSIIKGPSKVLENWVKM